MPASKGGVRVEGVREVQTALKKLAADSKDLKAAHMAVASALAPGIGQRTPRRSGALAASWKPGATKTRARLTTTLRYGGVIEYGWPARGIEAARMIRATIDASHAVILETYETELARLGAGAGFGVDT